MLLIPKNQISIQKRKNSLKLAISVRLRVFKIACLKRNLQYRFFAKWQSFLQIALSQNFSRFYIGLTAQLNLEKLFKN